MNRRKRILTVMLLGLGISTQAQLAVPSDLIREQTSPVTAVRDELYQSPALKSYQRKNTFSSLGAAFRQYNQDLYLQQEGSGRQLFTVQSETYLKPGNQLTLWGHAYYNTEQQYKVRFNETADYAMVYPYVMADSLGGDLKTETYRFSGGMAKVVGPFQLGFSAGFRGYQNYRDRDPRPKNISSTIDLTLSASRKIRDRYALALDLQGTRYSQRNTLNFVSELGKPFVFHDAGLGVYNKILSGSLSSAWFNGLGYGADLQLSSLQDKGWFASAGVHQFNIKKRASKANDNSMYEVGETREQTLKGSLGYLYEKNRQHFIARGTAAAVKRKGIESVFDIRDSEVGIYPISASPRYLHQYNTFGLRTVYGRSGGVLDWYGGLDGSYEDHLQRYALPNREISYELLRAGADVTLQKQLKRTMVTVNVQLQRQENLSSGYSWNDVDQKTGIFSMLQSNYQYLSASAWYYGGQARVDFPLTAKLSCYIQAAYGYQTTIGKNELNVLTAFQF